MIYIYIYIHIYLIYIWYISDIYLYMYIYIYIWYIYIYLIYIYLYLIYIYVWYIYIYFIYFGMNIIEHPFASDSSQQFPTLTIGFNLSPEGSSPRLTVEREVAVDLAEARSGGIPCVLQQVLVKNMASGGNSPNRSQHMVIFYRYPLGMTFTVCHGIDSP